MKVDRYVTVFGDRKDLKRNGRPFHLCGRLYGFGPKPPVTVAGIDMNRFWRLMYCRRYLRDKMTNYEEDEKTMGRRMA